MSPRQQSRRVPLHHPLRSEANADRVWRDETRRGERYRRDVTPSKRGQPRSGPRGRILASAFGCGQHSAGLNSARRRGSRGYVLAVRRARVRLSAALAGGLLAVCRRLRAARKGAVVVGGTCLHIACFEPFLWHARRASLRPHFLLQLAGPRQTSGMTYGFERQRSCRQTRQKLWLAI